MTSSTYSYAMRGPVWALVVTVLGLHIAAAVAPELLWGGHHLSFVPLPYQIATYVLVFALAVPFVHETTILALARKVGRWTRSRCWRFTHTVAAVAVLGPLAFYGLQIEHTIFGDTTVRLSELEGESSPVAPWYRGDTIVRFYLHSLFEWLWNADTAQSFAVTSILYGVVFLVAAAGITRRLAHTAAEAGLLFGALTTSGTLLLFCGYIEVYSSTVALEVLFLWSVTAYSFGSVRLWLPVALLLILGFFHVLGMFVGPALACAVIYRQGLDRLLGPFWRRRFLFVFLTVCVVGGWLLYQFVRPTSAIPLIHPYEHIPYTLLSPGHILYLINENILVALPGWMALFVVVFLSSNGRAAPNSATKQSEAQPSNDTAEEISLKALIAGGVVSFAMMGVVNPFLGRLDWDLMSIHSPVWVLMGTYLLVVRSRRFGGISSHTTTVIVTLSLFHTIPWIVLQQFPARAAKAIEAMVEDDLHRAGDRNLKLGIRFEELGFIDEAIHQYEKAIEWDEGYYLSYYNLGRIYEKLSDWERSIFYYLKAIELNPSYPKTYNNLGGIYHRNRRLAEAVTNYERAAELDPRHAGAHANLGLVHYELGNYQDAVDAYERCLDINPTIDHVYFNLGAAYGKRGDYLQAARALRQFVARRPMVAAGYLNLANAYRQIGDVASASAAYGKFVELAPDDPHAAAAIAFLNDSSKQR